MNGNCDDWLERGSDGMVISIEGMDVWPVKY